MYLRRAWLLTDLRHNLYNNIHLKPQIEIKDFGALIAPSLIFC